MPKFIDDDRLTIDQHKVGHFAYAVSSHAVSEIRFNEVNGQVRATTWKVASIADLLTTKVYPGCVLQNLLFPETGQCMQHQLPELEGWQVLDAKYQRGMFGCVAEQGGRYKMIAYRTAGKQMDCVEISDDFGDVNFAVTDSGICAMMIPGGMLRIFRSKAGATAIRDVVFPEPDMQLFSRDNKIVGILGSRLYDIQLR